MLRFHAVGDWTREQVVCRSVPDSWPVVPDVLALIEREWEQASRRPGVLLFDGPMVRLEAWQASPHALELSLSRTSYKKFLGTNLAHPELADQYPQHGTRILANPVGVSPALRTSDGYLLMGRRNASVAYYPSRIHPFAGALDPSDGGAGGADVFAGVGRELSEELGLSAADLADVRCTGVAEDTQLRQPELIFRVDCKRTRRQVEAGMDHAEHDAPWSIPATADAVAAALDDVTGLTPVAVASLLHFGRVAFDDDWFHRQRARLPG